MFFAGLLILFPLSLRAETTKEAGAPKAAESAQYNTRTAKVIRINKATHTLSLEGEAGVRRELQVDPNQVKNFDNIKVGDLVVLRESQNLVLTLTKREKGEKPEASVVKETSTAPLGVKPSLDTDTTTQISAEVVKIDPVTQTVDLKGPQGNIVQLKAEDPKRLEGLKKGDLVSATYTKSLAISVEPMPEKK